VRSSWAREEAARDFHFQYSQRYVWVVGEALASFRRRLFSKAAHVTQYLHTQKETCNEACINVRAR